MKQHLQKKKHQNIVTETQRVHIFGHIITGKANSNIQHTYLSFNCLFEALGVLKINIGSK